MLKLQTQRIESAIQNCPLVVSFILHKEQLSPNTGYIDGEIFFISGYRLSFFEFYCLTENVVECDKYRYHFMDYDNNLIFRYDNAPHHINIESFPNNKHLPNKIINSKHIKFSDLIKEIEQNILSKI